MKQYQSYVFDLYGTLVDIRTDENRNSLWERVSLFFGYYGARYEPEELRKAYLDAVRRKEEQMRAQGGDNSSASAAHYAHEAYPEIPLEEVFSELYREKGVKADSGLTLHTGQVFRVFSTEYIRLYAHAKELLLALKTAGRNVYLLSNAQRIFTEYELRYLGIEDSFDGILISSDHGCRKPDERFFHLLTERYGLVPSESLMIGNDLTTDIGGARAVGMDGFYLHSAISPKKDAALLAKEAAKYGGQGQSGVYFYYMDRINLQSLERRLLR